MNRALRLRGWLRGDRKMDYWQVTSSRQKTRCRPLQLITCCSSSASYAWVLEHTGQHSYHIHAAFYLNGQKHRQAWTVFEALRNTWKYVTRDEGHAYRCEPEEHYRVRGERVTAHDDTRGRKGMQYILSYLSKQAQKNRGVIYQLSEIPAAPAAGRRRNASLAPVQKLRQ